MGEMYSKRRVRDEISQISSYHTTGEDIRNQNINFIYTTCGNLKLICFLENVYLLQIFFAIRL